MKLSLPEALKEEGEMSHTAKGYQGLSKVYVINKALLGQFHCLRNRSALAVIC